jgi:two-component system chemotaxis sensor kinase CheA
VPDQAKYKKIYLQESEELLQLLNKSLLILEKDDTDKDALNSIFRAAHTLKSMSASMGYTPVSELSHKMEDLLSDMRDGSRPITESEISILFNSFDALERMVRSIHDEKEFNEDISGLISALDSCLSKKVSFEEEKINEDVSLNVFEKKTLVRVTKDGYSSYHLKIILEKDCVLKGVRAFMVFRSLHDIGEVIKSFPDSESIEAEKFDFSFGCVFVTKSLKKEIKKKVMEILEIEDVVISDIQVDESWERDPVESGPEAFLGSSPISSPVDDHMRRIRSVRVDIERLDRLMNLVEELAINKLRLSDVAARYDDSDLHNIIESFGRLTDDLQSEVMKSRLVPVGQIFDRFPRLVRDLSQRQGKVVRFEMIGSDIELDRTVLDEIGDPIIHLIRNAVDHGIALPEDSGDRGKAKEGRVMLSAIREKNHVIISVSDDGDGMDEQSIKRKAIEKGLIGEEQSAHMSSEELFLVTAMPGFSTSESVTDVSGRGVGLDVVKEKTERLGGSLKIESIKGSGTKISMRLPITTAVVRALLVGVESRVFAVPVSAINEIVVINDGDVNMFENVETIFHHDRVIPLIRLGRHFSICAGTAPEDAIEDDAKFKKRGRINALVLEDGDRHFALTVDKLMKQQDIVIKQFTRELKGVRGFAGATILGDGSVALVLDISSFI